MTSKPERIASKTPPKDKKTMEVLTAEQAEATMGKKKKTKETSIEDIPVETEAAPKPKAKAKSKNLPVDAEAEPKVVAVAVQVRGVETATTEQRAEAKAPFSLMTLLRSTLEELECVFCTVCGGVVQLTRFRFSIHVQRSARQQAAGSRR